MDSLTMSFFALTGMAKKLFNISRSIWSKIASLLNSFTNIVFQKISTINERKAFIKCSVLDSPPIAEEIEE